MKVWLIAYSNYKTDVCADEKSARMHLKKLGLSDEEIEKAFLDGVHIEDDEKYDIGETWIEVLPNRDVIQYNVEESHSLRGWMLKESNILDYCGLTEKDIRDMAKSYIDSGNAYPTFKEVCEDIADNLVDGADRLAIKEVAWMVKNEIHRLSRGGF